MANRKRRNGWITAPVRRWPLYERLEGGKLVLSMRRKDKAEMDRLVKIVKYAWV